MAFCVNYATNTKKDNNMKEILNQFAWIEIKGREWIMMDDAKTAMQQYANVESQFQAFKADELEKQTDSLAAEIQKCHKLLMDLHSMLTADEFTPTQFLPYMERMEEILDGPDPDSNEPENIDA